jgi:predicted proteasome-type protease
MHGRALLRARRLLLLLTGERVLQLAAAGAGAVGAAVVQHLQRTRTP